jgi:tungstate transport system substrate-binding protein
MNKRGGVKGNLKRALLDMAPEKEIPLSHLLPSLTGRSAKRAHRMRPLFRLIWPLLALLISAWPYVSSGDRVPPKQDVILATTTSTQDSGLFDVLLPVFQKSTGVLVKTIAVGSGQALALGARGEVDVLLVHSPREELKFMEAGFGARRRLVMYNDFVLAGPKGDPAGVRDARSVEEAFRKVADGGFLFISRGDLSGTHVLETELWKKANVNPHGNRWYQESGQGMGQTLLIASEKGAYTLSDRGTYLALASKLALEICFQGAEELRNIYHVIKVNCSRFERVNCQGARLLADFLVSGEAQRMIRDFGVDRFGTPLFFPAATEQEK